jgi:hypothetical protein
MLDLYCSLDRGNLEDLREGELCRCEIDSIWMLSLYYERLEAGGGWLSKTLAMSGGVACGCPVVPR